MLDLQQTFDRNVVERFYERLPEGADAQSVYHLQPPYKFGALLDAALDMGCDYIATGHYAKTSQAADGTWQLHRGEDPKKDQSYFLYSLTQERLARTIFPLAGLDKERNVRRIAAEQGFINAKKAESEDICFIPDGDYAGYIERRCGHPAAPGDIMWRDGSVVGRHNGALRYTIGQRKGLGLAMGAPVYVCAKDMQANTVTVGPEENLFDRIVYADEVNWIAIPELTAPLRVTARTRYHQTKQAATVYPAGEGQFRLEFDQPQRAPTPGQAAVLYQGDVVLGGGTITRVEK